MPKIAKGTVTSNIVRDEILYMKFVRKGFLPSNFFETTRFPGVKAHSMESRALFPSEKTMPALTFQRSRKNSRFRILGYFKYTPSLRSNTATRVKEIPNRHRKHGTKNGKNSIGNTNTDISRSY